MPGVSCISIWHPEARSEETPMISSSVVLDLLETAETGTPTRELSNEDFPEFGGPTMATWMNLGFKGYCSGCGLNSLKIAEP